MATFSHHDYDKELVQHSSIHEKGTAVRMEYGTGDDSVCRNSADSSRRSSLNSTSLKRKPSRNSFLAMVAFDRKYDADITPYQQRKCPLIGCEKDFNDPELMLQHVYYCLPESKGFYRCFRCKNEERIGKYHKKGCELHQSKDPSGGFAWVVKRLFPHRSSKQHLQPPAPLANVLPQAHEIDSGTRSFELTGEGLFAVPLELSGDHEHPMELEVIPHAPYLSAEEMFQQGMFFEVGTYNDTLPAVVSHADAQHAATELEASNGHTSIADFRTQPPPNTWAWEASPEHFNEGANNHVGYMRNSEHSLHLVIDGDCQSFGGNVHSSVAHATRVPASVDGYVSPLSPTAHDNSNSSTPAWPTPVSQYHPTPNSTSVPSMFSTSSSISTTDNSFSSFDSSTEANNGYQSQSMSFLGQFAPGTMCSEPEELEQSMDDDPGFHSFTDLRDDIRPNTFVFASSGTSPIAAPLNNLKRKNAQSRPRPRTPPLGKDQKAPVPLTSQIPRTEHRCICGHEPSGKEENKPSNLRRHQRNCRWCTDDPHRYTCKNPECGRSFSRSDNLLDHQRKKHKSFVAPQLSEPDCASFELEAQEVQAKRRRYVWNGGETQIAPSLEQYDHLWLSTKKD